MPRKGASNSRRRNSQLWVTLPGGARAQVDQLVALGVVGDSHSEVIRHLVISQLTQMYEPLKFNLIEKQSGKPDNPDDDGRK